MDNTQYEYPTFPLEKQFLLGELTSEREINDKIITCEDILNQHLKKNFKKDDEIEIDNPSDKPILRKYIKIQEVNDYMIDLIYYQHQISYDPYKFVMQTDPMQRGRILIKDIE